MEPRSYLRPAPCASEASASVRIAGSGSTRYDSVPRDPGTGTSPRSDAAAPLPMQRHDVAACAALTLDHVVRQIVDRHAGPRALRLRPVPR